MGGLQEREDDSNGGVETVCSINLCGLEHARIDQLKSRQVKQHRKASPHPYIYGNNGEYSCVWITEKIATQPCQSRRFAPGDKNTVERAHNSLPHNSDNDRRQNCGNEEDCSIGGTGEDSPIQREGEKKTDHCLRDDRESDPEP